MFMFISEDSLVVTMQGFKPMLVKGRGLARVVDEATARVELPMLERELGIALRAVPFTMEDAA